MQRHDRNQCNFSWHIGFQIIHLESQYSHVKDWGLKFFFVSRKCWEFPLGEVAQCEFFIRASWHSLLVGHCFDVTAIHDEISCLNLVYEWVKENLNSISYSIFLITESINHILVMIDQSGVISRSI